MGYHLLNGIRVHDLTMVFSGPIGSKILAEMGAEIIKIESVSHVGAFTRLNVYPENEPGEEPWNRGSIFHSLNAGKRGVSREGPIPGLFTGIRLAIVHPATTDGYV
jgi:crotonobetainyl-CoA:carnitine CoA-transferase CaiB-like acyl-CoA transferase